MAPYRNCICATSVAEAFTGAFQVSSVEVNYEDTAILFGVIVSIASNSAMAETRIEAAAAAAGRVASPVKWLPMPLWSAPNG
jgi:hypothetical protein